MELCPVPRPPSAARQWLREGSACSVVELGDVPRSCGQSLVDAISCAMIRAVTLLTAVAACTVCVLDPEPALGQTAEAPAADPVLVAAKADFEEAQVLYIRESFN